MEDEKKRPIRTPGQTTKMKSLLPLNLKQIEVKQKIEAETISVPTILDKTTEVIIPENTCLSSSGKLITDNPDQIKKTILEAFIKVVGCRRVTVETMTKDGNIIKTDVEETEDDPEIFKICTQEKISDDLSKCHVQKPDNFMLSYQFLGKTNFTTNMSFKCPKFVNTVDKFSPDPVFVSLNTESAETEKQMSAENVYSPAIQVLNSDIQFQMTKRTDSDEISGPHPRMKVEQTKTPGKKPSKCHINVIATNSRLQSSKMAESVKKESTKRPTTSDIPTSRESKRLRKPSMKLVEMKELEESEKKYKCLQSADPKTVANNCIKVNNEVNKKHISEQSSETVSIKQNSCPPALQTIIKEEPGINQTVVGVIVNCNNSAESSRTGAEILDVGIIKKEDTIGELVTESSCPILDDAVKTVNEEAASQDTADNETDFSIFDDDIYEEKYGKAHKTISRLHTCTYCSKKLLNRSGLRKHLLIHKRQMKIENEKCEICKKSFSSEARYQCHLLTHKNETDDGKHKCGVCDRVYSKRSGLLKHQRLDSSCLETKFVCEYCHVIYTSERSLEIHRRKHLDAPMDKKEICNNCGKCFETRGGLNKHKKQKACELSLTCDSCGKFFNNQTVFSKHIKSHTRVPNEQEVCDECGKVLGSAAALRSHKNSHLNLRNFKCKYCGKAFLQKGTLVAHERIHTGDKPYLCGVCATPFRYSSHLRQHSFIHTGETPYGCSKCERAFSSRQSLKKHLNSHDNREKKILLKMDAIKDDVKEEYIDISEVIAPSTEEIVFLNDVMGDDGETTQYIYTTEDGQQIQGYLASASDTIIATGDSQSEYQDGQSIIYQTVEAENVTFVDEMQTSDLNILAETAQNYESPGVTYVIVKK